jgi:Icc-related predicted phosphoesterase
MRILHVTDFHFNRRWYAWLSAQAGAYDACCLTGDLLDMLNTHECDLNHQARWVRDWMREFPGQLFVCTGNHDWWVEDIGVVDRDAEGAWLKKAARRGVAVDGAQVAMQGYRFRCASWVGPLDVDPTGSLPVILLSHAPPSGTFVSADLESENGDSDTTVLVGELPLGSLILSGHIHSPGRWYDRIGLTWCFNPGCAAGADVPNHIVIDTRAGTAVFRGGEKELGPIRLE